jgi:UDP:flavonoid glycosyltransferase YjiC (YdhE family)
VLATRSYRQAARRLARIIGQHDGAAAGASALQDFAAQPLSYALWALDPD